MPAPGAVPGLPHGGRQCPLCGRILGLPRGAGAGGSCAETSAGGAPAAASGVLCFPCPELACPACRILGKKDVLPREPELVGWEGHGQSCGGASIPFPEGAGMWSWEQPGLLWLWEPHGVCRALSVPHCCCFRVSTGRGRALQRELRSQERLLLPPDHPWLLLRVLSVPGK